MDKEQLIAYIKKSGPGQQRITKKWVNTPPRDTRDLRVVRCGNCVEKCHQSSKCKNAAVPVNQRPCWTCWQTGHRSDVCPTKKRGNTNIVGDDASAEAPDTQRSLKFSAGVWCVDEEGYQIARGKKWLDRTQVVLADVLPGRGVSNRFDHATVWDVLGEARAGPKMSQKQRKMAARFAKANEGGSQECAEEGGGEAPEETAHVKEGALVQPEPRPKTRHSFSGCVVEAAERAGGLARVELDGKSDGPVAKRDDAPESEPCKK